MNVIFGSGLIGLLAKEILGDSWDIVPFYKSRFFTHNPSLDDNFIIYDDEIDDIIKQLSDYSNSIPIIGRPRTFDYKISWSSQGSIIRKYDKNICEDWLYKIFGDKSSGQSEPYMRNRMDLKVYDIRCNNLYSQLLNKHYDHIKQQHVLGQVTSIGKNNFVRNGRTYEFDKAINTIPLDALFKLMKIDYNYEYKPIHYLHIATDQLNFEGSNQLLVADNDLSFFRVTNIAKDRYLFYFHKQENFGLYLMSIIPGSFEILDGTVITDAIPLGFTPNLVNIENDVNIFSVGSYAQHDWCMDVGSCILRLIRYANRGNQPTKLKTVS